MNPQIGYFGAKIFGRLKRDKHKETLNKWFKKCGVHLEHGGNGWININSNIAINEPHLIYIGQNTTIAGNVEFITHDNSVSKIINGTTDLFGKIIIGRNCFIGARSIIMYGVSVADNVVIAAGSVVTKSIKESNVIVAGNPARVISTWNDYELKYKDYTWDLENISREEMIEYTSKGYKIIKK